MKRKSDIRLRFFIIESSKVPNIVVLDISIILSRFSIAGVRYTLWLHSHQFICCPNFYIKRAFNIRIFFIFVNKRFQSNFFRIMCLLLALLIHPKFQTLRNRGILCSKIQRNNCFTFSNKYDCILTISKETVETKKKIIWISFSSIFTSSFAIQCRCN